MKNLAGVQEADKYILEELYLAGIKAEKVEKTNSEVPYTFIGKIGRWTLERAWCYWIASVRKDDSEKGLPLEYAFSLYNKKHPTTGENLGEIIRAGGDSGSLSPKDYVSQPFYNEELDAKLEALGYKKEYSKILKKEYISISVGEVAQLCNEGKLIVDRYVFTYHIDELIGLKEFASFLKNSGEDY